MKKSLSFITLILFLLSTHKSYSQSVDCAIVVSGNMTTAKISGSSNCTYTFTPTVTINKVPKIIQFAFTVGASTQYLCYTYTGTAVALTQQTTPCGSDNQTFASGTLTFPTATFVMPCTGGSLPVFSAYNGANTSGATGQCILRTVTPLPVKLIAFTAKNTNGSNILNWQTASESNSDRFVVQRSADAKTFEDIAEIEATGESQSIIDYQCIDTTPLDGINYYRLKQIDKDNSFTFSKIISVNIESVLSESKIYTYPNPVSNNHLKITGIDTILDYQVYTQDGKMIACKLEGNENEYTLSFNETPKTGVYILWTKTQKQTQSYRIIIE